MPETTIMLEATLLSLVMAVLGGTALGMVFFGGLWWTVQRAALSPRPALWFGPGLLIRLAIACAGFYFLNDGTWQRLTASLAGFVLARMTVLRMTRGAADAS
jgi:F1F0 ATPase subunit 2